MKPLVEEGISLNPYESVPVKTEVKFWGLIISSPDKVKALIEISDNKEKKKNYLASYARCKQMQTLRYLTQRFASFLFSLG